jgi:hypothetical protein
MDVAVSGRETLTAPLPERDTGNYVMARKICTREGSDDGRL